MNHDNIEQQLPLPGAAGAQPKLTGLARSVSSLPPPHALCLLRHADQLYRLRSGRINWNIRAPEIGSRHEALKNHLVAMTGEFVGTFLFLFFALGIATTVNTIATPGQSAVANLLVIALAFGFSLATTAWVFFRCVSYSTAIGFVGYRDGC
jgi:hypothetical protein